MDDNGESRAHPGLCRFLRRWLSGWGGGQTAEVVSRGLHWQGALSITGLLPISKDMHLPREVHGGAASFTADSPHQAPQCLLVDVPVLSLSVLLVAD